MFALLRLMNSTVAFFQNLKSVLQTLLQELSALLVYVRACVPPGVSRLLGPSRDSQQEMAAGAAV